MININSPQTQHVARLCGERRALLRMIALLVMRDSATLAEKIEKVKEVFASLGHEAYCEAEVEAIGPDAAILLCAAQAVCVAHVAEWHSSY